MTIWIESYIKEQISLKSCSYKLNRNRGNTKLGEKFIK